MDNLLKKAYDIAQNKSVTTQPNGAVVYSVSYMPTEENKKRAFTYIKDNPTAQMLDDTPCGKALIELGLDGKVNEVGEEITEIWRIASSRYIKAASGNIHAFVEGADERSTFCMTELTEIMHNPRITHINGVDKELFLKNFKPKHY